MTILQDFGQRAWNLNITGEAYIETGVGLGESMLGAVNADQRFQVLHGIEINQEAACKCASRFRADLRIKIHQGSSPLVLPKIMDPSLRTTFWLDAHYEGPQHVDNVVGQCPLIQELRAILAVPWKHKPVIMIDDYSAFMSKQEWWQRYAGKDLRRQEWPTFSEIYDLMGGVDFKWKFLAGDDGILYCW